MVQSRIGSLCVGSVHPRAVIPPLLAELRAIAGDFAIAEVLRESDLWAYLHYDGLYWIDGAAAEAYAQSEDAVFDLRDILNALNEHAESFTYYGPHPSDPADYGCWVDWDAIGDAIRFGELLQVSDIAEIPEDYCGSVILVNDHGNATLYNAFTYAGGQVLQEQWSIV